MKVVYPKNIQKGMFAGLTFQIGPITLSIIQLVIIAIGVASAFGIFNALSQSGGKVIGSMFALIVLIIFLIIAFFKISELALIPFVAKMIRNLFFDTPKKFQINYEKHNPIDIAIKKSHTNNDTKQVIEQKSRTLDKELVKKMNQEGLL